MPVHHTCNKREHKKEECGSKVEKQQETKHPIIFHSSSNNQQTKSTKAESQRNRRTKEIEIKPSAE
jgi:hypothetical protein